MNNPIATYRLQFQKDFTFKDLEGLIPYFKKLGISIVYASPVFRSTAGSMHGYDGVNPNEIDQEIGSLEDLKLLSSLLKNEDIGWLQDIVPNHMAFHSENPWLMDVLEKGMQSVYHTFFDVAWNSRLFHGKLMLPFLNSDPDDVIQKGEILISYTAHKLMLRYESALFPLNADAYLRILEEEPATNQAIQQITTQIREAKETEDAYAFSLRWAEILLQIQSLMSNDDIKDQIEKRISSINADTEQLNQILGMQSYALCHWQKTEKHINFRRFFTVNGLLCLNIQHEEVFNEYHRLTKTLIEEGVFQGLRIDHVDGLYDPARYLSQIQTLAGSGTYVAVEKILGANEELPAEWPVAGATGYEFLGWVNNLLTHSSARDTFTDFYIDLTGQQASPSEQLLKKKAFILFEQMAGELENLYQLFIELNLADTETVQQAGEENIKNAIAAFLIHCPVYRYYGNRLPFSEKEKSALSSIFSKVKEADPQLLEAVNLLSEIVLIKPDTAVEVYNQCVLEFYSRCMQFTGPLMAKGGEDTLMYTYQRFVGHNDVGDSPENFGLSPESFHKKMKFRNKYWPFSLNTTSTHDTKRGEDVRARLNILTDLTDDWLWHVKEWMQLNAPYRQKFSAPDSNDEYFIYQNMIGAYPMPGTDEDDFGKRFEEYLTKALREAKTHTNYTEPNEAYETGTIHFVRKLLNRQNPFWEKFSAFHTIVSDYGIINSLSQLLLKFTCPGIPDVYQGCEFWDLSLVDPDNRRPVDYVRRQQVLNDFEKQGNAPEKLLEELWNSRRDGRIKLWLTNQLFLLRKKYDTLFAEGEYIPMKVEGIHQDKVIAFARSYKKTFLITAIPLNTALLCEEQGCDFFNLDWGNTRLVLPARAETAWKNVLNGNDALFQDKIPVAALFRNLPLALFEGTKADNQRNAGILAHISSLASPFGIGDLGPEAYHFADFLNQSNQRIWQLLPLNPTEASQGNSPYSALSSRAGNSALISPELLKKEGLLNMVDLTDYYLPQNGKTDYTNSELLKLDLLKKAYTVFKQEQVSHQHGELNEFYVKNQDWLDDFALYIVLKNLHQNKHWTEWEENYKLRDPEALQKLRISEADQIDFVKWVQYIFDKQWKALKQYCNERDIKLLGDLPFYVSYNSADVWAHRNLFLLDTDGKITGIAGVPPDAFSKTGQLWGMPIYNWTALREQGYQWWIERLRKNTELFDSVRLDHFRAFADYWQVPGGSKTAEYGEWKSGPGLEFFDIVKNALGNLPFIAEDLGESSSAVFELRDQLQFPGMKVLQFAFDELMPQSEHIPHHHEQNFIVYTGTHDNNTTRGWFKTLDDEAQSRLQVYTGLRFDEYTVYEVMARLAYASVAKTAVLPIQDILNLDENGKMNTPGSDEGNWLWRLQPGQLTQEAVDFLKQLTVLFDRD